MLRNRIERTALQAWRSVVTGALILAASALLTCQAGAAELDGAWTTNVEECSNIFVKKGNELRLAERADFYGSGFVISGNIIRGKIAICKINSIRKAGATRRLRSTCATDITISDNTFVLTVVDANKVIRRVPGIPEMDTPYVRCPAS